MVWWWGEGGKYLSGWFMYVHDVPARRQVGGGDGGEGSR